MEKRPAIGPVAVATCIVAAWSMSSPTRADSVEPTQPNQTAGRQDPNRPGRFALDSAIAFASTRDGNLEVYLMDPDGTNQRRLTNNSDGDGFANLSPNGKKLVFDSNRNRPAPGTLQDQDGNLCPIAPGGSQDPSLFVSDLFLMKTDGKEQTHLRSRSSSADWSPDGKYIAFHMSASGKGCPSRSDPGAAATDSDIFVANVDDLLVGAEEPIDITNSPLEVDDDADWSSTGRIVYTAHDKGDDVTNPLAAAGAVSKSARQYTINPDGTGRARVTDSNVEERAPNWSPDGNTIAYLCRIADANDPFAAFRDFEICVVSAHPNPDGTLPAPTVLTENTVGDLGAGFSPDGERLVVQRAVPGQGNQLFTMTPRLNPDGTLPTATQLTFPPGANFFGQWGMVRVKTTSALSQRGSPGGGAAHDDEYPARDRDRQVHEIAGLADDPPHAPTSN